MSDSSAALVSAVEDIIHPLQGDNPCGVDISYDDQYLKIKSEVDRLGQPDYGMIVELSSQLLVHKSKDLRVVGYLAVALFHTQGTKGLAEGLGAIKRLVVTFWDGLYPGLDRLQARRNALQFVTDRLSRRLEQQTLEVGDVASLEECLATISELEPFLAQTMGNEHPALSKLADAVTEAIRRTPRPTENLESPPGNVGDVESEIVEEDPELSVSDRLQQLGRLFTRRDAWETEAQSRLSVQRAVSFMREKDLASPVSYLLLRSLHWGGIKEMPSNEKGKTLIPGPPKENKGTLKSLEDRGEWDKLLVSAENLYPTYPLWIDLQYMVYCAMQELGSEYVAAREAIIFQTMHFMAKLPELSALRFQDETPFVSENTRIWFEETVIPASRIQEVGASTAGQDELKEEFESVEKLFRDGDLARALEVFQGLLTMASCGRRRFEQRLYMANLCMRGRQPAIARPLLEILGEEVAAFSLETWDPEVALEVWTQLRKCYSLLSDDPNSLDPQILRDKADRVTDKICRLDLRFSLAEYNV